MPLAARILFGVFGLVAAVYAGASLAGHVTPPWWERTEMVFHPYNPDSASPVQAGTFREAQVKRSGRELISIGVGAVGLAALAFAAWPRRLPLRVSREPFTVLAFDVQHGVTPDAGLAVREVLNAADPEGWWFVPPGSFFVLFASERDGAARALRCRADLEPLRAQHESLRGVRFGQAEGPAIAHFDREGHLQATPLGEVVNDAMRNRA